MAVKYKSPLLKSLHILKDDAMVHDQVLLVFAYSKSILREVSRLEETKRMMRDLRQNQQAKLPKSESRSKPDSPSN